MFFIGTQCISSIRDVAWLQSNNSSAMQLHWDNTAQCSWHNTAATRGHEYKTALIISDMTSPQCLVVFSKQFSFLHCTQLITHPHHAAVLNMSTRQSTASHDTVISTAVDQARDSAAEQTDRSEICTVIDMCLTMITDTWRDTHEKPKETLDLKSIKCCWLRRGHWDAEMRRIQSSHCVGWLLSLRATHTT